jgi:hypothetical protein
MLDAVGSLWLGVFALGVLQRARARMHLQRRLRAAVPAPQAVRVLALQLELGYALEHELSLIPGATRAWPSVSSSRAAVSSGVPARTG